MFTRVKEIRRNDYLQIVENYRDGDRVRQRLVLYVGRYDSIDEALHRMRGDLRNWRARRTRITRIAGLEEVARKEVEDLNYLIEATDGRLQALRALTKEDPGLLERDRKRAARRPGQVAARYRARRAQRERERRASAERSDSTKRASRESGRARS
jgi:hypothetical protein